MAITGNTLADNQKLSFIESAVMSGLPMQGVVTNDGRNIGEGYAFTNITTATTTTVKSGSGFFKALIVNKGVATATITIYDNTAGSGTKIGTITFGAALLSDPGSTVEYCCKFSTGLTIVTSGATDLTVIYK